MKVFNKVIVFCIVIVLVTCGINVARTTGEQAQAVKETTANSVNETVPKSKNPIEFITLEESDTSKYEILALKEIETSKPNIIESSEYDENVAYAVSNSEAYTGEITKQTDLSNRMNISSDQLNYIIDTCTKYHPDSAFKGTGSAFIEASKKTGYDPIFLLSLAAQESGWGVSNLHRDKNNPYSIAMYDTSPEDGYVMGDDFESGIVNGAVWIHKNYYDEGQTTLEEMNETGSKIYATDDNWVPAITAIMNECYQILEEGDN